MPLSPHQRQKLLMADRTNDAAWVAAVVEAVLAASLTVTLLKIDRVLRNSGAQSYLIARPGKFQAVIGMPAMMAAIAEAGVTIEQNRTPLAMPWRSATN